MAFEFETLAWQPSRDVIKAAAFLTIYLFFWTLTMLWSFWIRISFKNCECTKEACIDRGGGAKTIDPFDYWLFIETLCVEYPGPLVSLRKECTAYEDSSISFFSPGQEHLDWQLAQSSVLASNLLISASFVLLIFALAAPSTAYRSVTAAAAAASPKQRSEVGEKSKSNIDGREAVASAARRKTHACNRCCGGYSKRRAQQLVIALNVVVTVLCVACGLRIYTSSSYDTDAWSEAVQTHFNATCDVTATSGSAVPCGMLAVAVSATVVFMLAFPGAHCLGYHEPGRLCAHCVDQSVDVHGTSLA